MAEQVSVPAADHSSTVIDGCSSGLHDRFGNLDEPGGGHRQCGVDTHTAKVYAPVVS